MPLESVTIVDHGTTTFSYGGSKTGADMADRLSQMIDNRSARGGARGGYGRGGYGRGAGGGRGRGRGGGGGRGNAINITRSAPAQPKKGGKQAAPAPAPAAKAGVTCTVCGASGHKRADCKMKDKACSNCGKVGHLKATCRADGGGATTAAAAVQNAKDQQTKRVNKMEAAAAPAPAAKKGKKTAAPPPAPAAAPAAKPCLCCGVANHTKADCKKKDSTCSVCNKVGHLKKMCRSAAPAAAALVPAPKGKKGQAAAPAAKPCLCCGAVNHNKPDCKKKDSTCSVCNKVGHLKKMCRSEGGGLSAGAPKPGAAKGKKQNPAPPAKPKMRRGLERLTDLDVNEQADGSVKLAISVQKPQAADKQAQQQKPKKKQLTKKQKQQQREQQEANEEYANRPPPPPPKTWEEMKNWDSAPNDGSTPPAHHGSATKVPYTLGMIYVAEKAAQIRSKKEADSKIVSVAPGLKNAPELVLEKDECVQGIELGYINAGGKQVPRVKVDCRSLIALRTGSDELLPDPVYGWISIFSSVSTLMILTPVPADHLKPVKMIIKSRGGFVEPAELKKMACAGGSGGKKGGKGAAKVKTDRELHHALTAEVAAEVDETKSLEKKAKGKKAKAPDSPKKPATDEEADAVAARSASAKGFAGLKEAKNESKADKFVAKKALDGLKEGRNESKADSFLAKKALSGLKEGQNESKADAFKKKKAMEKLKEGQSVEKADQFVAKKAIDGLKEGKNESKAEAFQMKKAMGGLKGSPTKGGAKVDEGDDAEVKGFLEGAVADVSEEQPENPMQALADKCSEKAAEVAAGGASVEPETPEKTAGEAGPCSSVLEAVRRIKKYHDVGELGAKKLVVEVKMKFPELLEAGMKVGAKEVRDAIAILGEGGLDTPPQAPAPAPAAEVAATSLEPETPEKTVSDASADSEAGPCSSVLEAVRRIKKYHDVGELGAKKLLVEPEMVYQVKMKFPELLEAGVKVGTKEVREAVAALSEAGLDTPPVRLD